MEGHSVMAHLHGFQTYLYVEFMDDPALNKLKEAAAIPIEVIDDDVIM